MIPTRRDLQIIGADNSRWPRRLTAVPRAHWPDRSHAAIAVWRSRDYLVQVFDAPGGVLRMSVCRTTWDGRGGRWRDGITWDELQRLKAEVGYGDCWAVEIYPPDDEVVNAANLRHLWLLAERPPFAWQRATADGRAT